MATPIFHFPTFAPQLTFGPFHPQSGWEPGPSGPLPDPRLNYANVGPFFGRRVQPLNLWGPNIGTLNIWPQQVRNNAYATQLIDLYVAGWLKPSPSPTSGF